MRSIDKSEVFYCLVRTIILFHIVRRMEKDRDKRERESKGWREITCSDM